MLFATDNSVRENVFFAFSSEQYDTYEKCFEERDERCYCFHFYTVIALLIYFHFVINNNTPLYRVIIALLILRHDNTHLQYIYGKYFVQFNQ